MQSTTSPAARTSLRGPPASPGNLFDETRELRRLLEAFYFGAETIFAEEPYSDGAAERLKLLRTELVNGLALIRDVEVRLGEIADKPIGLVPAEPSPPAGVEQKEAFAGMYSALGDLAHMLACPIDHASAQEEIADLIRRVRMIEAQANDPEPLREESSTAIVGGLDELRQIRDELSVVEMAVGALTTDEDTSSICITLQRIDARLAAVGTAFENAREEK